MKAIEPSARVLFPKTPEEGEQAMLLVEYAGRNCYRSHDRISPGSYEGFITRLVERGHLTPLEFADVVFELVTSRDVMAQITRHRLCSFCIQSQRYVVDDRTGDLLCIRPAFYIPSEGDKRDVKRWCASRMWEQAMEEAEANYSYLLRECSMPAQDARKTLPNSAATVIVMKCNLRELWHILSLRTSPAAYPEMRVLASKMKDAAREVYPFFISLFDSRMGLEEMKE